MNGHHIDACDKYFYFLNPGDELEINFTGGSPLQTLLIMLTEQFVGSVLSASRSTDEELLSSPMLNDNHHHFPGVPFSNDGEVRFAISRMLHKDQDPGNLDIILSELLQAVYPLSAESTRSLQKTGAKKTSTRQELYRRLFLAKEIMHDNVFENPTLDELAGEICLNKFHFLSRFRKVFGLTPHLYLNELKLQKATELLISSKYTVSDVCFMLGFASPATFSLLFKKRFKVSPSSLRKK
jgi:AraC-like DNA-binding protein